MSRLRSIWLHWWLGRRLLRASGQRWALAALVVSSTFSSLLILGLAAVPNVLDERKAAEAARTVIDTGDWTGVAASASTWDWRGEEPIRLLRVGVEANSAAGASRLPGVPRAPQPGEVWLSPQLAHDVARDSVLSDAFPQRVVGIIDSAALSTSQDRVAYIGLDPKSLTQRGIQATRSIGAGAAEFQTSSPTLVLLGGATLGLFVGVPLGAVFVAAFGLLAQPRQRQVRLLQAMGVTRTRARMLVCADGVVAGALGTVLAWLLFEVLSRAITWIPLTPARWTSGQPDIGLAGGLLSLLVPLGAAAFAAWRVDRRRVHPRQGTSQTRSASVPLPLLFTGIGLVAVLATSRVRADASPLATAAVVAAVALAALSATATVAWTQRAVGRMLLRTPRLHARTLVAGARLARVRPRGSRTASMLVPVFVLALAVAPVVAQVAPRDTATAALNQSAGRVIAFVSPVPDSQTQERIRSLPGVLAVSAPHTNRKNESSYAFACPAFAKLLARETCTVGAQAAALDLSPELSASWPYTGAWTFHATKADPPPVEPGTDQDLSAPLIVLAKDPESYWAVAAAVRGIDPILDTEANTGGLVGGTQQTYLAMQEWLKAGLALLLLASGALMALGTFTDIRERAHIQRAMTALGVSAHDMSEAVGMELVIRNAVVLTSATIVGSAVAGAAQGWGNAETIGARWVAGLFGLLLMAMALGTFIPLLAIKGNTTEHVAEDAYVRG